MFIDQNEHKQTHSSEAEIQLKDAIDLYLQTARLHNRSKKTMELYHWIFDLLMKYFSQITLEEFDTERIRIFLTGLMDKGWKPTSVSIAHRIIKAFLNWAIEEELLEKNPIKKIPAPKTAKIFPFTLDENEVDELFKACDKNTKHGYRNYVILLLFIDCGLRLNELISLRTHDLSIAHRSLRIQGKGAKERFVFIGAGTNKALRKWLRIRGNSRDPHGYLFIDRKNEPLKSRWVQEIVARLGKKANLSKRLAPHKLRHVSATMAVRNGMDAFTLQRLYGWENITTAMRYVNAATPALQEAHAKASPVDHILD
jgi:site-specific recombinase XerD